MLVYHMDACKKSKITPQFVLTKGFCLAQCCERRVDEYLANGYRINTRYANGFGQTFFSVLSPEAADVLSKITQRAISNQNTFIEIFESFGPQMKSEQKHAIIHVRDNNKLISLYKIEDADTVERIDSALCTLRNCGIKAVPRIQFEEAA